MTYKKADFYSSPTMRQFSKIASDKGWIKPEQIEKRAESNEIVSDNLMENTLSLTAKLKSKNNDLLNKLAEEIEYKLLQYKAASSAEYGLTKETGEDLVDQAHPKGSHKMENMIGDALIETVVDQQKAIHEVVFKKPKGKLANKELIAIIKQAVAPDQVNNIFKSKLQSNLIAPINKISNDLKAWISEKTDNGSYKNFSATEISSGIPEKLVDLINQYLGILFVYQQSKSIMHTVEDLEKFRSKVNEQATKIIGSGLFAYHLPGWSAQIISLTNSFMSNVVNRLKEIQNKKGDESDIDADRLSTEEFAGEKLELNTQILAKINSVVENINSKYFAAQNKLKNPNLDDDNRVWIIESYLPIIREDIAEWKKLKSDFSTYMVDATKTKPTPIYNGIKINSISSVTNAYAPVKAKLDKIYSI